MDDCYTELAGAYKDVSHCDNISDEEKKTFCMDIASRTEEPANETESSVDIQNFLEFVDNNGQEQGDTNVTE